MNLYSDPDLIVHLVNTSHPSWFEFVRRKDFWEKMEIAFTLVQPIDFHIP
jgi:hypothetical protein